MSGRESDLKAATPFDWSSLVIDLWRAAVGIVFLLGAQRQGAPEWLTFAVTGVFFLWLAVRGDHRG